MLTKKKFKRLLFALVGAKAAHVDAVILKKKTPEFDILLSLGGTIDNVDVIKGFETEYSQALKTNAPEDWVKIVENIYNYLLDNYPDDKSKGEKSSKGHLAK